MIKKQENKDILIDTKIMKRGQNLAQIPRSSGLVGCYGIFQPKKIATWNHGY